MKALLLRISATWLIIVIGLALATCTHEQLVCLAFVFGAVLSGLLGVLLVMASFITGEDIDEANQ